MSLGLILGLLIMQPSPAAPVVAAKWQMPTVKPSTLAKATVTVTMADGLHTYQNPPTDKFQLPLKVTVSAKGFVVQKIAYPAGETYQSESVPTPSKVYAGSVEIPVTVKTPSTPGTYAVTFRVDFQQCDERSCWAPGSTVVTATLRVAR